MLSARLSGLAAYALLVGSAATPAASQSTFERAPSTLPEGRGFYAAAPADYDGDGDFDLLAFRTYGDVVRDSMLTPFLYRNDGVDPDGTFRFTELPFPAPSYPTPALGNDPMGETLAWGDADGDGDADVVLATPFGSTLYANDGGTFTPAAALPRYSEGYSSASDLRSAVWADIDNDGDADLFLPESIDPTEPFLPDSFAVVLYRNDGGALTRTPNAFPYSRSGIQVTTGDVDGDGDNDLLFHDLGWNCSPNDMQPEEEECLVLFENQEGLFVDAGLDFPNAGRNGMSDLADIDSDGNLDMLYAGDLLRDNGAPDGVGVFLFRNTNGAFQTDTLDVGLPEGERFNRIFGATLADYDGDGDADILLSGRLGGPDFRPVAYVLANDGVGGFVRTAEFEGPGYGRGSVVWADFDGDGDLDHLATGAWHANDTTYTYTTWLYRNDTLGGAARHAGVRTNAPPTAPSGLLAEPVDGGVALSWTAATDDRTAAAALTYNVRLRAADGREVMSALARPDGARLVPAPGNVGLNRAWTLTGLAPGAYTWAVQAIDNAYNGGAFAEGAFTVGAVAVEPDGGLASAPLQVFPNPARTASTLRFTVGGGVDARVEVFDALGRVVARPFDGPAVGAMSVEVDVAHLSPGLYVARLVAGARAESVRFSVVR